MTTINALQADPHRYIRNINGSGEAETTARAALKALGVGTDEASIRAFQRANNLKDDGLIGRETLGKLTAAKTPSTAELAAGPAPNQARVSTSSLGESGVRAQLDAKLAQTKAAPEPAAIANAPAKGAADAPSIELGADGKLRVKGSSANEEIMVAQDGDQVRARIRNIRDPQQVMERSFAAKDVRSAEIDGGDGNDLIWNGTRNARGIDHARITMSGPQGGDVNAVFSNASNVQIDGGKSKATEVAAIGDRVAIKGSTGADTISVVGEGARVSVSKEDTAAVAGRDSRIEGAGTFAATNGRGYILGKDGRTVDDVDPSAAQYVALNIASAANGTVRQMEQRSVEIDQLKK